MVSDRTDNWREKYQLMMLSGWNRWTELLTVNRQMMKLTCNGINCSSASSLSC